MHRLALFAALAGLVLAIGMIVRHDAAAIFSLIAAQGIGLLVVIAFHAVPLFFSASAWWSLAAPRKIEDLRLYLRARILREAVGDLVPGGPIGGPMAGVRLLILKGTPGITGAGVVVVDQTAETLTQVIFALAGVALLAGRGGAPDLVAGLAQGLGFLGLGICVFLFTQRTGVIAKMEAKIVPLLKKFDLGPYRSGDLHAAINRIYDQPAALAMSFLLHLASWCAGMGEIWLILHLIGIEISLAEAFVLESLCQAIRSAAFMIPSGLGVQEGGLVLLGAALGLDAQVSLTLSLTKRLREVAIGVPALLAWSRIERRRLA